MLIDILIISIVVALLRKGKIERLVNVDFKKIPLIIFAFVLQYFLILVGERGIGWFEVWGAYLHIVSYLLLFLGIFLNRHIKGMGIFGIGILLNFIVIIANGGAMPVSPVALKKVGMEEMLFLLESKTYTVHKVMTDSTKLKFLADVIPLPYLKPRVVSVGDILMAAGVFLLIQAYMVGDNLISKIFKKEQKNADTPLA